MKEKIIQVFNADLQPVFIGMDSGKAKWTVPRRSFRYLTYMAHLADGNSCYYEDLRNQAVAWTLPFAEMSPAAVNAAKVLQTSDEMGAIDWINEPFPEDESIEVMLSIDDYLLAKENGESSEIESEEDDGDVTEPEPVSVNSPNVSMAKQSGTQTKTVPEVAQEDGSLSDIDANFVNEESDSESGSGGTMYSEDEEENEKEDSPSPAAATEGQPPVDPPGAKDTTSEDSGVLNATQILRQSTIKVSLKMLCLFRC